MSKRFICELVVGGWIGDDKQQNWSIICYNNHREIEYHFNFKGIGKYDYHNKKELSLLVDLLNQLLLENKKLTEIKDIENSFKQINLK